MPDTNTNMNLYVSTSLLSFEAPKSAPLAPDFRWHGIMFRRLDPAYYSWLKARIDRLAHVTDTSKITVEAYIETLDRFAAIHEWVMQRVGSEKLAAMVAKFNEQERQKATYVPPEQ